MLSSYVDLTDTKLHREHHEDIEAGDVVRSVNNEQPEYDVLAVVGGHAWLRRTDKPWEAGSLTEVSRCQLVRKAAPGASEGLGKAA